MTQAAKMPDLLMSDTREWISKFSTVHIYHLPLFKKPSLVELQTGSVGK